MSDTNNEFDKLKKNLEDNPTYQNAFAAFKQRFLIEKKSIFDLESEVEVLTEDNIDYLIKNFVENGYTGKNALEKFRCQLITNPQIKEENDDIKKGAVEILATAVWLWKLAPVNSNQDSRVKAVNEILSLVDKKLDVKLDEGKKKKVGVEHENEGDEGDENEKGHPFFQKKLKGLALVGQYYNTNKALELAYLINFFNQCLSANADTDFLSFLTNEHSNVKVVTTHDLSDSKQTAKDFESIKQLKSKPWLAEYKENNNQNTEAGIKTKRTEYYGEKGKKIPEEGKDTAYVVKAAAVRNALLHLLKPDDYEPIVSIEYKEKIKKTFSEKLGIVEEGKSIDDILSEIKNKLIENKKTDKGKGFYSENIVDLWMNDVDFESKNIILHGAPGTGKTYQTDKTIKSRLAFDYGEKSIDDYYTLTQFHPSYGYEDFIDGIKPSGIDANGNMKFELVNGEFKAMCIKAFKELVQAKAGKKEKDQKEAKQFYFVADEINRAELSRVFGELLLCLEEDKRLQFDKSGKLQGARIKTQNSSLWKQEHAVVILEKGEGKEFYFGVPENLYFIGTMNDIDRSVDSFDMALRRRFVWKHYTCDYDVIMQHYGIEADSNYIKSCKALNDHITSEQGFGLGESYQLGHSYFMNRSKNINSAQMNNAWKDHIAPLLKEYLRSTCKENDIEKHLKEAQKKFTLPKDNNDQNS